MAMYDDTAKEKMREGVSVFELALKYGVEFVNNLERNEVRGACPIPGCTSDHDGFHVNKSKNRWLCHSCHPSRGWLDAAQLVMAVEKVGYRQAMQKCLDDTTLSRDTLAVTRDTQAVVTKYNQYIAQTILDKAQQRLWSATKEGEQARGYLKSRSLLSPTWEQFQIGAWDWKKQNTGIEQRLPSIVLPWYDSDGSLAGLRYRHLSPDDRVKYRWYGSTANRLFGWQANTQPADTVILCEGEINALSIYQATLADDLHVFSLGSQTNRLSESIVAHVLTYRRAIVWMDEPDRAQAIAKMLPNAVTIDSASMGGDADQLLTANRLSEIVRCLL